MGLDISAYSNIEYIGDDEEGLETKQYTQIYLNRHFSAAADGLKNGFYAYEVKHSFRAGSYSGYNDWRSKLKNMVDNEKDFHELINFSDCEGVIGSVTSKKLLEDFKKWDNVASAKKHFYESYKEWQKAFELASNNGCVSFL